MKCPLPRLLAVLAVLLPASTVSAIDHVSPPPPSDARTTWTVPGDFSTIQSAIDAASDGDTILVAQGQYAGPGNTDLTFGGKKLLLTAPFPFSVTIFCGGVRGATITADDGVTIDGFLFFGGAADTGGGLLIDGAAPVIRNSGFQACGATGNGGAIAAVNGARPELTFVAAFFCSSGEKGGGMYMDDTSGALLTSCFFVVNESGLGGGGLWMDGGPEEAGYGVKMSECEFDQNTAGGSGGAFGVTRPCTVSLHAVSITSNHSGGNGGGIYATNGASILARESRLAGNASAGDGGALYGHGHQTRLAVHDCLVTGNRAEGSGGGIQYADGCDGPLAGTTIAGNAAGMNGGGLSIDDSILSPDRVALWGNSADGLGPEAYVGESVATLEFKACVANGLGIKGGGTISYNGATLFDDPLFCDPKCFGLAPFAGAEYTVDAQSVCLPMNNPWNVRIGAEAEGCPIAYTSNKVELLSNVRLTELPCEFQEGANDVWGYVSPSGREYAIMGLIRGTAFFDVTDATAPVLVDVIDDAHSLWSDIAVYGEYAYNVNEDENPGDGVQIFDLTQIDAGVVTHVGNYTGQAFNSAHNIAINEESGFAYLCLPNVFGTCFAALDLSDPAAPVFAGSWPSPDGANGVHDVQVVSYESGPYAGREIAFAAVEGSGFYILDVTDKSNILEVSSFTYPNLAYTHQSWLSEDRKYLFVGDELDETQSFAPMTTTHVVDVEDLENPAYLGSFTNGSTAIDHNIMVRDHYVFEANYSSGLRIFDFSDIDDITEVAWFDTHPETEVPDFVGAWGIYTALPSGVVLISDIERGLYVFNPMLSPTPVGDGSDPTPPAANLPATYGIAQNRPNPFNPVTTIHFELPERAPVSLSVYDVNGRLVRSLVEADAHAPGRFDVRWDGRNEAGSRVASGIYYYRLQAGDFTESRSMVMLK